MSHIVEKKAENYKECFIIKFHTKLRQICRLEILRFFFLWYSIDSKRKIIVSSDDKKESSRPGFRFSILKYLQCFLVGFYRVFMCLHIGKFHISSSFLGFLLFFFSCDRARDLHANQRIYVSSEARES